MSREPSDQVRFIADAMLGRLARWLRLLGFDTLYYPDIRDGYLLRIALREGRCILTRDSHFLEMKGGATVFFVRSNEPVEQVKEVIGAFPVKRVLPGRCVRCNGILCEVETKDAVRDMIPEYVFLSHTYFLKCQVCGSVYWEGTHLKRFREMMDRILREKSGKAPDGK